MRKARRVSLFALGYLVGHYVLRAIVWLARVL